MSRGKPNRRRKSSSPHLAAPANLGLALKVVSGITLASGLGASAHFGYEYATTSPRFSVREVAVEGLHRASESSVVALSGVQIGVNIFSTDLESVQRAIEAHPWVREAEVHRDLPSRIEVRVREHEPVLLVALGHLYYANADGEIVKRYAPGERERFPVVTGLTRHEIETDDGSARLRLRGAVDFLRTMKSRLGDRAPEISDINLDPAIGLSFEVAGTEQEVVVGHAPWDEKVDRFDAVRAEMAAKGLAASRILLTGERRRDRAVAKLGGAVGAEAPVPQSSRELGQRTQVSESMNGVIAATSDGLVTSERGLGRME